MSLRPSEVARIAAQIGRAATMPTPDLPICNWVSAGRHCKRFSTRWHPMFGEVCVHHAAELEAEGFKCRRLPT